MEKMPPPHDARVSSNGTGEAATSPTLATASSGETNTQTTNRVPTSSTVRIQTVRVLLTCPERPHTELDAVMEGTDKCKKQGDGQAKPESRKLLQDYKITKEGEKKSQFSCPGAKKCKRSTCNHSQDPKADDIRRMVKLVVTKCQIAGYIITDGFAKKWLGMYPDNVTLAAAAARYDITAREAFFQEDGRISFSRERAVAVNAIHSEARDGILDFMDKEERLFKDFYKNGKDSVWGLRCKNAVDKIRGVIWFDSCDQEAKYRVSRQKHFKVLRDKVTKGEITQEYMDTCVDRIDNGYAQKQHNRAAEVNLKANQASTGDGKDTQSTLTIASSSSVSDSADGKKTETKAVFKTVAVTTMQSKIPICTAAPTKNEGEGKEKDVLKGKAKEAYVEDQVEPDNEKAKEDYVEDEVESDNEKGNVSKDLRTFSGEIFKAIYGRSLPESTRLDLLQRFMDSIAMHDPRVHEIVEINNIIDGGAEYSELFTEVFEERISKAEWYVGNTRLLEFDVGLNSYVEKKTATLQNMEEIQKDGQSEADDESTKEETSTEEKPANKKKNKKKKKNAKTQEADATSELAGMVEEASVPSSDEVPQVARPPKGEQGLFKTMAKAKVESKRKADGTLDEELMSFEMLARDAQASGSATESVKAHKASLNVKSSKDGEVAKSGSNAAQKKNVPEYSIQYKIKLREKGGEMEWPPMAVNFKEPGFDSFLAYHGDASSKLLRALVLELFDVVGGFLMIEDGPGDAEGLAHIKEITTITNDRVAELLFCIGGNSAALGAHLYGKFEMEVNHYFIDQGILPGPADFENEALRFAIWMYMARDLDDDIKDRAEKRQQMKEAKENRLEDDGEKSGDESEGLYDE